MEISPGTFQCEHCKALYATAKDERDCMVEHSLILIKASKADIVKLNNFIHMAQEYWIYLGEDNKFKDDILRIAKSLPVTERY